MATVFWRCWGSGVRHQHLHAINIVAHNIGGSSNIIYLIDNKYHHNHHRCLNYFKYINDNNTSSSNDNTNCNNRASSDYQHYNGCPRCSGCYPAGLNNSCRNFSYQPNIDYYNHHHDNDNNPSVAQCRTWRVIIVRQR
jgi:hypothetical protein